MVISKYVLPLDSQWVLSNIGTIAINGNKIAALGQPEDIVGKYRLDVVLRYERAAVLHGFVDAHTHNTQILMGGLITDQETAIPRV
ncbi:MAG: hypothetical protein QXK88_02825 [Desulfurococcaceae archaeon]